jgi:hypothetical protein
MTIKVWMLLRRYGIWKWWHDRLPMWVAWHLPRRVVFWCAIRVGSNATTGVHGTQVVPELLYMQSLERWDTEAVR